MIKLILIDDEPLILDGVVKMIDWDAMGITVVAACTNALTALEIMKDDMPDILLADVKMPGMSGLELVEQARMLNPALQCIILSAYDDFAFAQRALRAGVIEYLLKPVSEKDIRDSLQRAMDTIRAEQTRREKSGNLRREKVAELAERLMDLPCGADGVISPAQVQEACMGLQDDTLLQEAMTYIVAHSAQGLAQAEWSMRTVIKLYAPLNELYANSAHALSQLHSSQESKRGFVQQMKKYVHEHYSMENLSLQYLADHQVYLSADYIGKEFSRATGMKFSAYLLSVRMEKAKSLLSAQPDLHTCEIAESVGLGHNPRYFSQLFRKYPQPHS